MITSQTHEIETTQHHVLDLYYFSKQINRRTLCGSKLETNTKKSISWQLQLAKASFLFVLCSNRGLQRNICQWTHFENRLHSWFRFTQNKVKCLGCWNVAGKANCRVFQSQSVLNEGEGEKHATIQWFKN